MALLDALLGRPLASEEEGEQKIGVLTGLPTLGLDGLGSAAYGPEASLTVLLPLGALGLAYIGPITLVILALLGILYFSYRQTIAAYPNGGGSYTVAKENLGTRAGLLAAAALMLDFTLNVAVGISTGIGALISAVPRLQPDTLWLCLGILALITIVNLRGVRESGVLFALPTYLFVGSLGLLIVVGLLKSIQSGGHPHPVVAPPALPAAAGTAGMWLRLRAFASGCTAMTGVEAVSNGVTAFKKPTVPVAQRTLTAIVVILGVLLAGIAYLTHTYAIGAMDQTKLGYQSVLSQMTFAVAGRGAFYYITLASILLVLTLSANTSYAGFPRLCRLLAQDSFLPHSFAQYGRRLVYSIGIVFLTVLSALLLIVFRGITDRLIPLFAVGAFAAFTLSQAGMVLHWRRLLQHGQRQPGAHAALAVNALGAAATAIALGVIIIAKFSEGAWITLLLIPALLLIFSAIKRHYTRVTHRVRCPHPLHVSRIDPPVVLVPVAEWNRLTESALRLALSLSAEVTAIHIHGSHDSPADGEMRLPQETLDLQREWTEMVERPAQEAGLTPPRLVILPSPYRKLYEPLLDYIEVLKTRHPNSQIAVVIPELVEKRWWEMVLHGHAATGLKAALLFRGDPRIVVVNVPWYLDEPKIAADQDSAPPQARQTKFR